MLTKARYATSAAALALALSIPFGRPALGAIVPFTEDFAADSANWRGASDAALITWQPAGGPDDRSFISGVFNFAATSAGDPVVQFRGQEEFGSSGGAFVGDWIADGIEQFTAYVRHDAEVPLTFFVRFSLPSRFPGGTAVSFAPVPAHTWTPIIIPIAASNPQFVTFENSDFDSVFGNIGNVQVGVSVPEGLAGVDATVGFDLDKVAIVPEPAVLTLLVVAAGAGMVRRRRTVQR
jgi:hypothetical protein